MQLYADLAGPDQRDRKSQERLPLTLVTVRPASEGLCPTFLGPLDLTFVALPSPAWLRAAHLIGQTPPPPASRTSRPRHQHP
jgi:hypothetical protein